MKAVIVSGGKQHHVQVGQTLKLEQLPQQPGEQVTFEKVLLVSDAKDQIQIGTPFLTEAKVLGKVLKQGRHKKVEIIKMRRRKHSMTRNAHRQSYTEVEITDINA